MACWRGFHILWWNISSAFFSFFIYLERNSTKIQLICVPVHAQCIVDGNTIVRNPLANYAIACAKIIETSDSKETYKVSLSL